MKDMIKRIREEKGGFTMAELLIVVAIVAVLVAIAIPVFTAQLNEAKYATDEANARSIYAEMRADYLAGGGKHTANFNIDPASVSAENKTVEVTVTSGSSENGGTQTTNTYNFSGIVNVTFTKGTTDAEPTVTVGAYGDHKEITFGGTTSTTPTP